MKVSKFPYNPGPAAWNCILPPGPKLPKLEENHKADWLIIGAGFAGLSAARRLQIARPSDRIIVLEATALAEGPSGRNSGFMIDLPHDLTGSNYSGKLEKDRLTIARNRMAINFARETVAELNLPHEAFKEIGKINGAAGEKGLRRNFKYAQHLTKLGEEHHNYDAKTMKNITGINYYKGGLFTPGTVMLQPALYIRSLGEKLISNQLKIYENSPVISLNRNGSDWQAKTPHGVVSTPKVILATNGHAESFGYFKRRLVHVFTYGSMTRPLTTDEKQNLGGESEWSITSADPMGTTVRKISEAGRDRILVRNRVTYEPLKKPTGEKLKRIYKKHNQSFQARFPIFGKVEMEYKWGGHLALSLNNVGAFSEIEKDLFTACCQNGLGTVTGTLHGMAAAELAMELKTELVQDLLSDPEPKKLPPNPIDKIGAFSRIRWGELTAGKEL